MPAIKRRLIISLVWFVAVDDCDRVMANDVAWLRRTGGCLRSSDGGLVRRWVVIAWYVPAVKRRLVGWTLGCYNVVFACGRATTGWVDA